MTRHQLRDLRDLLNDEIRVRLDRERILALNPEVTVSATTALELAEHAVPPWFFDGTNVVAFDAPEGVAHTFQWVAKHSDIDASARRVPATPLAVPCYRVGERVLCLDANHRLLALVRLQPQGIVATLTIEGPCDPAILPDLVHWI